MNHIDFLKLSHAYLRGVEIRDTTGLHPIDRDTLARQINLYLNEQHEIRNDQRHDSPPASHRL